MAARKVHVLKSVQDTTASSQYLEPSKGTEKIFKLSGMKVI